MSTKLFCMCHINKLSPSTCTIVVWCMHVYYNYIIIMCLQEPAYLRIILLRTHVYSINIIMYVHNAWLHMP